MSTTTEKKVEPRKAPAATPKAAASTPAAPTITPELIAQIAAAVGTAVSQSQTPPQAPVVPATERESFIVFNPRPGVQCISDAKIQFDPFEAKDLTWEDERFVKNSLDLRKALQLNLLVRISPEQYENILSARFEREKLARYNAKLKKANKLKTVKAGDMEFEAEEVGAASGNVNGESELVIEGGDNDPLMYAAAYHNASKAAAASGKFLDGETFHQMIQGPNGAGVLRQWAKGGVEFPSTSFSGDPRKGRATVAQTGANGSEVASYQMTNFTRDQMVAGLNGAGGVLQNANMFDDHFSQLESELAPGETEDLMEGDEEGEFTGF